MSTSLPQKSRRSALATRIAGSALAPGVAAGGVYLLLAPAKYDAMKAFLFAKGISPGAAIALLVPFVLVSTWVSARFALGMAMGKDTATSTDTTPR